MVLLEESEPKIPNSPDYYCYSWQTQSTVVGLARLFWKILQDVV